MTCWDEATASQQSLVTRWVQEYESSNYARGTLRGLHFQAPPHAQTKLVRVTRGAIIDVFVDLRKGSPTYGQWDAIELSDENHMIVFIPAGFAHGYCTITDNVYVTYKVDQYYAPQSEGGLAWNDKTLRINWPTDTPIISARDANLPGFDNFESPF